MPKTILAQAIDNSLYVVFSFASREIFQAFMDSTVEFTVTFGFDHKFIK